MDNTLLHLLALTKIKGIGPKLIKNLISFVGSAELVFQESSSNLSKIEDIGSVLSSEICKQRGEALKAAEKEFSFVEKNNIRVVSYLDKEYSYRLKECDDAPILLYSKGNIDFNVQRFVGIVGTRNATEYGKDLCRKFVSDLAVSCPDVCIVSGLAYGIDICAHQAALDDGLPTVAVLAHGLDRLYPSAHRQTAMRMLDNGGLITEFTSGTEPDRPNFVQRNRIVAGMCDAILVVESARKGGSLITADFAQQYNRDVFAFPGRVGDEYSDGCNRLIMNSKANLIQSAAHFLWFMNWEVDDKKTRKSKIVQTSLFNDLTDEERNIMTVLHKDGGLQINQIAVSSQLPISKLSSLLMQMEFKGLIKHLPGDVYKHI